MHYFWSFNTKFQRNIGVIYRSPSQSNAEFEEFLSNFEDISNTTASPSSIILWHVNARSSFWWKNDKTTVEGARLVDHTSLHFTENHIFFFQTSWKDGFSKKIGLKYDLSCIIGEDDISFSRKYDLAPWKWKMIFLKKNTRKYYISFKRSEKMVFSKRTTLGYDLYCIISKDGIFSRKHDIFSLDRELGVTFLRKYKEIWYFPCTRTCVTNVAPRPSVKKHQRWSYPAKIHLIVIDVLDWRPIKSFSNSLYFHGDLYRRVHVLLYRAAKQNRKLNI